MDTSVPTISHFFCPIRLNRTPARNIYYKHIDYLCTFRSFKYVFMRVSLQPGVSISFFGCPSNLHWYLVCFWNKWGCLKIGGGPKLNSKYKKTRVCPPYFETSLNKKNANTMDFLQTFASSIYHPVDGTSATLVACMFIFEKLVW